MSSIPSQPFAAAIFADCLFNTTLLPASINSGANPIQITQGSITNGANWIYADPGDANEAGFIANVNQFFSGQCYGTGSGYNCVGAQAAVKPCRYVVMHRTNQGQAAHQLLVDASGNYTFYNTTWTS